MSIELIKEHSIMIGTPLSFTGCTVALAAGPRHSAQLERNLLRRGAKEVLTGCDLASMEANLARAQLLALGIDDRRLAEDLRRLARRSAVPVIELEISGTDGSITLLGGGPGAVDLLTLRGLRALARADIIYADRLGPTPHLAQLAPQAQVVDVGKLPGFHRVPQSAIQQLMIASAQQGAHVVRLKGGDPFVFGRGYEELEAATEAGIDVEVVPGLSSCITVPAAAGIPVTHRGVSRMFTVVSAHDPLDEEQLEHLARLRSTIVVLMGVGTLEHTAAGLQRWGLPGSTACAIVESGTTARQRTTRAPLADLAAAARRARCTNPAVIVIGEVAALGQFRDLTMEFTA